MRLNRKKLLRVAAAAGALLAVFVILCLLFPLPLDRLHPPGSTRVLDREGRTLRVYVSSKDAFHFPVTLEEVSPHLVEATIAFEDRWFRWHPGINPVAIIRALRMNARAGRIVSGGSTITQQVARLMEPRPRSLTAKIIEAFRALQLEIQLSKRRILEAYFNLAPYGGNIQGVAAASLFYFGKPVAELGPGEAALLAVLPNSPSRFRPDRNPSAARGRRDEVLRRMHAGGDIDTDRYRLALAEGVPDKRFPLPWRAPHLGDMLYAKYGADAGDLCSTIDLELQDLVERLLQRHLQPLRARGITNGAVVVIDNETRAVRALVGSAGYFHTDDAGQVNGAVAPRSPGSTLKPFAYGLALDNRLISPSTLLEDVPVNIGGYTPHNYDGQYHGVVTAFEALTHSMNVPAVNLVAEMGAHRFCSLLKQGGLTTLTEPYEYYGLSLILGGAGISLLELTNLYATLAGKGRHRPYRLLERDPVTEGLPLFSPAAAYILTDMLSHLRRPDFPSSWEFSIHLPKIAWKTGTSYGHRDAWSIGYNPRYTIGIWLGNFSGIGSPALVGAEAAGPLLFDIATTLEGDGGTWFTPPPAVGVREVCSLSGLPPGPDCEHTTRELFIVDVSPHQQCDLHVRVAVDDQSGHRLCPHCWAGRSYHWETFVQWPPTLATWLKENGYPVPVIPTHNPECRSLANGTGPVICSPARDVRYVLRAGIPLQDQQIRLEASVTSGIERLYWFVDGVLLSSASPGDAIFYMPERGSHKVVCMDNEGRSSRLTLIVE